MALKSCGCGGSPKIVTSPAYDYGCNFTAVECPDCGIRTRPIHTDPLGRGSTSSAARELATELWNTAMNKE